MNELTPFEYFESPVEVERFTPNPYYVPPAKIALKRPELGEFERTLVQVLEIPLKLRECVDDLRKVVAHQQELVDEVLFPFSNADTGSQPIESVEFPEKIMPELVESDFRDVKALLRVQGTQLNEVQQQISDLTHLTHRRIQLQQWWLIIVMTLFFGVIVIAISLGYLMVGKL